MDYEKGNLHIGLQAREDMGRGAYLALRMLVGGALGGILAVYLMAILETVGHLLDGTEVAIGTCVLLLVGGWAVKQMIARLTWREPAEAVGPAVPATGSVNA